MTVVSGRPLIPSDAHILKSFHTKSRVADRDQKRDQRGTTRRPVSGWTGFTQRQLRLHTEACGQDISIVLGSEEGSAQSCALQIYFANNKYGVNLSGLHVVWYVRNVGGK